MFQVFIKTPYVSAITVSRRFLSSDARLTRINKIEKDWKENPRWAGVKRRYTGKDVDQLKGSVDVEYTLARKGANKLWTLLNSTPYVQALGAMSGNQAIQQMKAGLKAIYVSGWQVAADANTAATMYPDMSLYPVNSVPNLVKNLNNSLARADQIHHEEGDESVLDWYGALVADAEAGFGGVLNIFEIVKALIEAGAAGIHFEDQLASAKKCGHMGGKVLVPTGEAIDKLISARLATDVMGVPTVLIARTDGEAAAMITSDLDENDIPFCTGKRTPEGYYCVRSGIQQAISRAISYAPYADLLWCETPTPDIAFAKKFADAVHCEFPGKPLAYNCSPSFNWRKHLSDADIKTFQSQLGEMGYKFQFITSAGFHTLNYSMFDLGINYVKRGMDAFVDIQDNEFKAESMGYTAIKQQREVGAGYFDAVMTKIKQGKSSTMSLKGSTEEVEF